MTISLFFVFFLILKLYELKNKKVLHEPIHVFGLLERSTKLGHLIVRKNTVHSPVIADRNLLNTPFVCVFPMHTNLV